MQNLDIGLLINSFLVLGGLFAAWKGGRAERAAAALVIANAVISEVVHNVAPSLELVLQLVIDAITAVALLAVTIRYAAPWMGGVMFFFAAQFALHSYYLVMDRPSSDNLHAFINNLNWSGITWCLIIGATFAWRRRVKGRRASLVAADQPAP